MKKILLLLFLLLIPSIALAPMWPIKTRASQVRAYTTNFEVNLSSTDITVQKALDTLDDVVVSSATYSLDSDKLDGLHYDAFVSTLGDTMSGNLTVPQIVVSTITSGVGQDLIIQPYGTQTLKLFASMNGLIGFYDPAGNFKCGFNDVWDSFEFRMIDDPFSKVLFMDENQVEVAWVDSDGGVSFSTFTKTGTDFYIYVSSTADSTVYIENSDATGVANLDVEGDLYTSDIYQTVVYSTSTVTDYLTVNSTSSFGGISTFTSKITVSSITVINQATVGSLSSSGQVTSNSRKLIDQYDYAVCITTPNALGTIATLISPFRSYAVTISTISAQIIGGTNVVLMVEQRTIAGIESAGTDIFSGDITVLPNVWTGGGVSDFTIPADSALVLVPTSVSGNVDRLMIKYRVTKD